MDVSDLFDKSPEDTKLSPEERIRLATLGCIEELGLKEATVRAIAAKANMNPAAVNYYFRSKDRLVKEALRGAWSHFAEDVDRIMADNPEPPRAIVLVTRFLIEGVYRYPRIIRAIIVEHPALRSEAVSFFNTLFERLTSSGAAGRDPLLGTTLLFSLGIFFSIDLEAVGVFTDLDLSNFDARAELSQRLAVMLFGTSA